MTAHAPMPTVGLQTIESQDLTLGKLFDDFYVVPSFQREYVWETKQVEQLLQDIHTEFSADNRVATPEYFIGSIVVCSNSQGVYELVDGQQRMTTIYLFFCAVRDHLEAIHGNAIQPLTNQIASADVDDEGNNLFRYRVTLQYEDSCAILEAIAQQHPGDMTTPAKTRSVENLRNAYHLIRTFLQQTFGDDEAAVRRFYVYATKNVKIIRVKTLSVTHALKVFETINDRGVGLNSMDLLKNLLFMHARMEDFERLKSTWQELIKALYQVGEKPLRFLRYIIFSRYNVDRMQEDDIYEWFTTNRDLCGYATKPVQFVEDLLKAAHAYARFVTGKDAEGMPNRYLENIRYLSGAARQHLILLLAGRHLPADCFTDLCRHLENLFFAYVITREPTKDFERSFAQWASALRAVHDHTTFNTFVAQRLQPAKESLATRFALAFRELNEHVLQKYRLRYILGKLTQYINEAAYGSHAETDLQTFIDAKVDVEHIFPQHPAPEVLEAFDKPDEMPIYLHCLGNLTLLEKPLNCSISNGHFTHKQAAYRQSKFLITKLLGEVVTVGDNTAINRAVKELETFALGPWNSATIERRQGMLARLAQQVWDMPRVSLEAKCNLAGMAEYVGEVPAM
jgi:hypothetical protein